MLNFLIVLMNFLVTIVFDLMIFVVIFQFILEWMATSYHHPLRLAILRYTQPLLDPIHKVFPTYRHVDIGLLFLIFTLEIVKLLLLFLLAWQFPNLALVLVWSIFLIINAFLNFYFFAIFFRMVISWIIPIYANFPITQVLFIITEPILRPFRQKFSPIKGFDWTPLAVIILLKILSWLILYSLSLIGAPSYIL